MGGPVKLVRPFFASAYGEVSGELTDSVVADAMPVSFRWPFLMSENEAEFEPGRIHV